MTPKPKKEKTQQPVTDRRIGNEFWKARSSHGRKPIFSNPEQLWETCLEYFEWVEANPLYEDRLITYQGEATHEPVAKMRAMTIAGLCIFLDISQVTWFDYAKNKSVGFSNVTTQVEEIIRTQKFSGAAADLLNANIIARDLGLADKRDLSNKDGSLTWPSDVTVVYNFVEPANDSE
jgi:hypothetical protein